MVDAALQGLDDATMTKQPAAHANSIAWILLHLSRVVDTFVNTRLQAKPDLWVREGWHRKFRMDEGGRNLGFTAEELGAWKAPSQEVQKGYFEAVKEASRQYISSLTTEDLDRRVTFPPEAETQNHSVATALGQLVWDVVAHGGQIAYLRGLYGGMGWHR
jgi:uncharacterized damage-inducible protein DinB